MTKEERLLVIVAELSETSHGDPCEPVEVDAAVKGLGVTEKSFWNMFNGLARANFLRKNASNQVWLTSNGLVQVERLRG
jgi:hypothetical protein